MRLLKLCTVLSALLEQLLSAWLWIPISALPQPSPGLCLVLRGTRGSPVIPVTCILHPCAGCWGFEFLKTDRVHWGFSFLSLSIFFSLLLSQSHTVQTSRFISSLPPFCEDREEVKGVSFFFFKYNFISPFSTINCLHVLQCSFSPNPNQKVSQVKANRSSAF